MNMSQDTFRALGAYRIKGEFDDLDREVLAYATSGLRILGSTPYRDNEIPNDMRGAADGFFTKLYKEHKTAGKLLTMLTGAMFVLPGCVTPSVTPNKPPVAELSHQDTVQKNQKVLFSASGSYDPDGKITRYAWDFGDGRKDGTLDPWIKHAYRQATTPVNSQ